MAINHNIDWEISSTGTSKTGSAFNNSNANFGLNYSYGNDYQVISIDNLTIGLADNYKPGIPSWTTAPGGLFPGGTYYVGIRYVALGGNNEIVAISELVEYADFIANNKTVTINSPANPGYPFDHYQVFIRELSGLATFAQLQNYGGGEVASSIGVNLVLNSFSTDFESILVADLPSTGNIFELSSIDRNFVANDIGNFLYIENNNIGFRSGNADEVDNLNFVEICKNNNYLYAAWFDLNESKTIKQISAVLWAQGSPSGDLFLELRSDNSGAPSNTILDSGGINANSLGSTPQWVDIAVNSNLAPGRYWVVINFDSAPDISNYVKLGRKTSTGFQDLNNEHLYEYNTGTLVWSSVNDGTAVAIGVVWDSTEIWGQGDYSPFILNEGALRFEILNVTSNQALIKSDYYVSEVGNIYGKCHLGGASDDLLQINEHATEFEINSIAHIQSGTYVLNAPISLNYLSLSGYETVHYDLGEKAKFQVDLSSDPALFDYSTGDGVLNITGNKLKLLNIEIDGSDLAEKLITSTNHNLFISHCWFHNSAHTALVFGVATSQAIWIESSTINNIVSASASSAGIYADLTNHLIIDNCYFNNIAGCGIYANGLSLKVEYSIFHDIYGAYTNNGHAIICEDCSDISLKYLTINAATKSGVHLRQAGSAEISNCLFTNGGDHGILIDMDSPLSFALNKIHNNAFYNNAGNQLESNPNYVSQTSPITLSSLPYVHIGLDYVDFTLNTVANGGGLLVNEAYPNLFYQTESLQNLDVGAVQSIGGQPVPRRNPIISLF